MTDAVIYARFSSDMQREESIDAQVRACKYYAQNFGYNIIRIYADRAKSGRYIRKREQFQAMLAASAEGMFSAVLVHKLDRFGRNGMDTLESQKILEQNGVELISVKERLDKTPQGKLMLYVIVGMNEFYSANLAQETMKGLKENAYKCLYTGGIAPLGYDVNPDKTFRINETEAEAVRLIFKMYADGCGYTEILRTLSARGLKTKRGRPFGSNSLHDLLTNLSLSILIQCNDSGYVKKSEKYSAFSVFDRWRRSVDVLLNSRSFYARRAKKAKCTHNHTIAFYRVIVGLSCNDMQLKKPDTVS